MSAARVMETFPEVVERVRLGGEVIIVERDGVAVCRIEPVGNRPLTVKELLSVLRGAVRPDDKYLDVVEEVSRNQSQATEIPWE